MLSSSLPPLQHRQPCLRLIGDFDVRLPVSRRLRFPDARRWLYHIPARDTWHPNNLLGIFLPAWSTWLPQDLDAFFGRFQPESVGRRPLISAINGGYRQFDSQIDPFNLVANLDFEYAMALTHPLPVTNIQVGERDLPGPQLGTMLAASDKYYCGSLDSSVDPLPPTGSVDGGLDCGTITPPNVLSISYAWPETDYPTDYLERQCLEFLKLGLQGVTVIVATGDAGVASHPDGYCVDPLTGAASNTMTNSGDFVPSWPATCPWVTAVRGTTQQASSDVDGDVVVAWRNLPSASLKQPSVNNVSEVAFRRVLHNQTRSSAGGFSRVFLRPEYQQQAVAYKFNPTGRAYPDVAALATGYRVVTSGRLKTVHGTSASAPVVASIISRINDARLHAGRKPVGFINPVFVLSLGPTSKRYYSVVSAFLYRSIAFKGPQRTSASGGRPAMRTRPRSGSALGHLRRLVVYGGLEEPQFNHPPSDDLLGPHLETMACAKLIGSADDGDDQVLRAIGCSGSPNGVEGNYTDRLELQISCLRRDHLAAGRFDPHEAALVSSPLLHSISVRYCEDNGYNEEVMASYTAEVIMALVAGLALNLQQHVHLLEPVANVAVDNVDQTSGGHAEKLGKLSRGSRGTLQTLELDGGTIWRSRPADYIRMSSDSGRDAPISPPYALCASARSCRTVAFARFHERNLTALTLRYEDTKTDQGGLALVVQHCPLLEHLAATIPRYRGGAPKGHLYLLIGELARLLRLKLHLDASPLVSEAWLFAPQNKGLPRWTRASQAGDGGRDNRENNNEQDDNDDNDLDVPVAKTGVLANIPKRAVIKVVIDSAVDEKLALAIFGAVSLGKEKRRRRANQSCGSDRDRAFTAGVVPLEALSLRVVAGNDWVADGAGQVRILTRPALRPLLSNLACAPGASAATHTTTPAR
ncbi:subtilisin-like protein [Parathielavia appendiculata]|uniref:Subtilisin-like protein n=1 Tax=Parathielavia appendiculata TaxID=2587402 RepID=A0AAN6Z1F4_9PEZI|nr:subtilisin-like protein [Parathielavia appendiculata]